MIALYPELWLKTLKEMDAMSERFGIEYSDVRIAAWIIAKDVIYAKLERDVKELKDKGMKG